MPKLLWGQPQQLPEVLINGLDDLLRLSIRQVRVVLIEEGHEPKVVVVGGSLQCSGRCGEQ